MRAVAAILLVAGFALLVWAARDDADQGTADAAAAERRALKWTGGGTVEEARRDGELWEVDVRRGDESLVEVTLGRNLALHELDEERGRGGIRPHDEITGRLRERAIAVARLEVPDGRVRAVERERDRSIEVDFLMDDDRVVEVEMDSRLRITEVDEEDLGDE